MAEVKTHQVDKKTWSKWSFYIDVVVFIIIALFIYLLILDSYNAGKIASYSTGGDLLSTAWLYIARDLVFLAVGLAWIFFRLYTYRGQLARRYW